MTTSGDPDVISAMQTNCFIHNQDHPLFLSPEMQQATAVRQAAWVSKSTPT